jgi:hypothetical protein
MAQKEEGWSSAGAGGAREGDIRSLPFSPHPPPPLALPTMIMIIMDDGKPKPNQTPQICSHGTERERERKRFCVLGGF